MIVRLKRLTLLCLAQDRDEALTAVRELGVVHVTEMQPPEGEALDTLRARYADAERALAALPAEAEPAPSGRAADDVVAEITAELARRRELGERDAALSRELQRYAGFGDFDPDVVRELAEAGVVTLLGEAPATLKLVAPEGQVLHVVSRTRERQHFVVVVRGELGPEAPDLGAEYTVVPWPDRPPAAMRAELAALVADQNAVEDRLRALAADRAVVAAHLARTAEAKRFAEVRAGMAEADRLAILGGYVPVGDCEALREAAAREGWGLLFDDPQPDEDVPTLLHNSRLVKPVRAVFDFLNIYPGYWEADVGWVFLPFFSIFFAMIVGDAGYAALLLILAVVLQFRFKKIPRHVLNMIYIVGAFTLVWGVMTGSYFGMPDLPGFLEDLTVPWLADRDNLIDLCFLIGAVHLSFAHVWNLIVNATRGAWTKVLAQVGWLLIVWSMFFLARQTVLGRGMPDYILYLLVAGALLVVVFMKTRAEIKAQGIIDHALLPLTLVNNFVDILSYIRLFAVGYAGVAVLAAFNDMAASIGFDNVLTAVAASVLLLFANLLNIVLCGLGVLVHAIRLNTLEFSTHKGIAWAGHNLFTPFSSERHAAH